MCVSNGGLESPSATRLLLPEVGHPFKIVNPCTDFGFKKAFCNQVVLIDFLNHILDYRGTQQIVELSYMDNEFPSLNPLGSGFTVDIVCKTQNDRYFLVEMQNNYTADYPDKAYIEFARFLSRIDGERILDQSMGDRKRRRIGQTDMKAQDFWQKMEEVCTLVISNKRFNPEVMKGKYRDEAVGEPDIINTYEMLNKTHPTRHLGNLEAKVVLVILANFNKTADELETDTERWLFALKNERMATGPFEIEPFKGVSDIAKTASESEALKQFYAELYTGNIGRDRLTEYVKRIEETNERFARHMQEAFEEGKVLGRQEKMARLMKTEGVSTEAIAICTGLAAEVIESL
jgi:PD-(D/E)XK nuclease family transposase